MLAFVKKYAFLIAFLPFWLIFLLVTPPLQNPDEDGHYAYVQSLSHGHMPLLPTTRADVVKGQSPEIQYLVSEFALTETAFKQNVLAHQLLPKPNQELSDFPTISFQANHPPFYFSVASLAVRVGRVLHLSALKKFYLTRMVNGLFYFLFLFFAYRLYRQFFSPTLSFALIMITGLQPMVLQMATAVNPEMAVIALATTTFYFLWETSQRATWKTKEVVSLGVLAAATTLSKLTGIMTVPVVLTTLLFASNLSWKEKGQKALLYLGVWALITAPWFLMNHARYGIFLPTNFSVVYHAPLEVANSFISSIGYTFHDFWVSFDQVPGYLGWLDAPMWPEGRKAYLWFFETLAVVGIISLYNIRKNNSGALRFTLTAIVWLIAVLIFLSLSFHRAYGYDPVQQGRYALLGLAPFMVLVGYGITAITRFSELQKSRVLIVGSLWYYTAVLFLALIPRFYV